MSVLRVRACVSEWPWALACVQFADRSPDQQLLVLDSDLWEAHPDLMGRTAVTFGDDLARTFFYTLGSKLAALIYMSKARPPIAAPRTAPAPAAYLSMLVSQLSLRGSGGCVSV